MAQGIAVCVSLNSVDPVHYQGWSGNLLACEFDAKDMASIAQASGFSTKCLLTQDAKRSNVVSEIENAASNLQAGDIFMLSYSGHGGQLPDKDSDEDDGLDETWCLFDSQMVDDEIFLELSKFKSGVRVLVFSDSCHSGSSIKNTLVLTSLKPTGFLTSREFSEVISPSATAYKAMPMEVSQRTYLANQDYYDKILTNPDLKNASKKTKAACLLISGCQDNQLSSDGMFNGAFTGMLKTVWNGGKFTGDYMSFHKIIRKNMKPDQTPVFFPLGDNTDELISQQPFSINQKGSKSEMSEQSGASKIVQGDQPWELRGHRISVNFDGVNVDSEADLKKLLDALTPMIAQSMIEAKQENKKEWSVSGTVTTTQGGTTASTTGTYTSKDWSASASGSTSLGSGVSGTATVTTGSQGTSGSIGISGTFP